MVGRHRQLMKRESPFPLRRETCTEVIDSPRDLLVWGLDKGLQTATQQLVFFRVKRSLVVICVCTSFLLKKKKKKETKERSELIRGSNYRLSWAKQQLLLLLCLVSASQCSCLELCTCTLFGHLLCLSWLI